MPRPDPAAGRKASPRRPSAEEAPPKPPLHPWLVFAFAAILPGVGQLLNGNANRALMFLFFMLSLGWITFHLTTPEHSFVGRYAGGFFIYAISVMDAYRFARLRWQIYHRVPTAEPGA